MKKALLFFSFLSFLVFSCTKDIAPLPGPPPQITPPPDSIVYTNIADTTFTSVRNYVSSFPQNCGMIPAPNDSSTFRAFDLDSDFVMDLNVEIGHWYQLISVSSPCINYGLNGIALRSLSDSVSFAIKLGPSVLFSAGD